MLKRMLQVGTTLGALALLPAAARADTLDPVEVCTGTSLEACVTFTLTGITATSYQLAVMYTSADAADAGFLTVGGLYDLAGGTDFNLMATGIVAATNLSLWTSDDGTGCSGLAGGGASEGFACAQEDVNGVNGLQPGQFVTFSFTTTSNITLADLSSDGGLGFRAHIQSYGPNGCSLKPDSRLGVVDGVAAVDARCGTSTVPEPISMLLVGSGLFGVGAIRRRRKGLDVVNG